MMTATHWVLHTEGDPLGAVRHFLARLFQSARLDGLLIPLHEDGPAGMKPTLVRDPDLLAAADPFAPLMAVNAAGLVLQLAQEHPQQRLGAVLRACEVRTLAAMARREPFDGGRLLIISADCLGTFSGSDGNWWDDIDQLTRKMLQFARQGGIAMYRYRPACQMCTTPMAEAADLSIGVLGLPVKETLLLTARDAQMARQLRLPGITGGEAPSWLVAQREDMRATLAERRERSRQQMIRALQAELPADVDALAAHLKHCEPCRRCMEACPLCASEPLQYGPDGAPTRDSLVRWLASCAGCGLCEEACPQHLPLTAVFKRLSLALSDPPPGHATGEPLAMR